MFDLLIHGGMVLDGRGGKAVRADVGVVGDRVEAIGILDRAEARQVVDATSKTVCPGFIDAHSHSDAYLLVEPSAPSKIHQGVTTEVVGNCGASAAPRSPRSPLPSDWQEQQYPGTWQSFAEYRALLEQVKPAVNVVLLAGHNRLRSAVVGYENRPSTADELAAMERLLAECLDAGARGLSTGLIYAPGLFAPRDEIVALARVAARRDGLYTTHMRSEGARLLEAIDEAVSIGRDAGIRVEISHLKTSGKPHWSLLDAALARIRAARSSGVEVAADRYPYTAGNTDLDVVFPPWAAEGGRDVILARLRAPDTRARLVRELQEGRGEEAWDDVMIGSVTHAPHRRFQGRRVTEMARELGVHPAEAVVRLTEADALRTTAFFFGMSEGNMHRILAEPWVMIGSDASLRAPTGPLSLDYPHPRAYGTFPRYLRMAVDGSTVPLPEAVRKMTALPAEHFRLADRGVLDTGRKADIVVFDPRTVRDTATYANPHQVAEGIRQVVVNGVLTLDNGRITDRRSGRVL